MKIFQRSAAPAATIRRSFLPLRLATLLAALVLVSLALDLLLYQVAVVVPGARISARVAQIYARHYLDLTDVMLRTHDNELRQLNRPEFLALVQAGDASALNAAAQQVLRDHPGLDQFAILPTNFRALGLGAGLSFSTEDLINQVFAGARPYPELSVVQGHHDLNIVQAIQDASGHTQGVLCAAFKVGDFVHLFRELPASDGRIVLMEQVAHDAAVQALAAGAATLSGEPRRLQSLQPNIWLEFTAAGIAPDAGLGALWLLLPGVQILLFGLCVVYWGRRWQEDLQVDVDQVSVIVDTQLHGQRPMESRFHFSALAELSSKLVEIITLWRRQSALPVTAQQAAPMAPTSTAVLGDITMHDEDLSLLHHARPLPQAEVAAPAPAPALAPVVEAAASVSVDPGIFRAYDIRGVVGQGLTAASVQLIGRAIASAARACGETTVIVARDGRLSGPELSQALMQGLTAAGVDVIDIGQVPTPVLYFATKTLGFASGVMLTGSHNPPDYNGLKIVIAGDTLAGDAITDLYQRIRDGRLSEGQGKVQQRTISKAYIERIVGDVALARPLKVVVDCGHGVTGEIAPRLLRALGCEIVPLYTDIDGHFPGHHPDPSKPENLADLIAAVAREQADIGVAFDGDGDRLGVVTPQGKIIYPDRLLMLFAKHVLLSHPGADIIFDVKCTRDLRSLIAAHGGRPLMCRTGHSFIKAQLKETQAALAGEMSGHIFFNDRWYGFDDGLYAAVRLLEILSLEMADADSIFAEFPENATTPELNIAVSDAEKFALVERLKAQASFVDGTVSTLDGLRVDFSNGWGLIRASNTTPMLVARFEGHTEADLAQICQRFHDLLQQVAPQLALPF